MPLLESYAWEPKTIREQQMISQLRSTGFQREWMGFRIQLSNWPGLWMKFSNVNELHLKGLGIWLADWNDLFQPESILCGGRPSRSIKLSVSHISFAVLYGFLYISMDTSLFLRYINTVIQSLSLLNQSRLLVDLGLI